MSWAYLEVDFPKPIFSWKIHMGVMSEHASFPRYRILRKKKLQIKNIK